MADQEVEVEVEVKTHPLYCQWEDDETQQFLSITHKWKEGLRWGMLLDYDHLSPFVYELTFDEFMDRLTKDKDEKSIEEIFKEYTGQDDLV